VSAFVDELIATLLPTGAVAAIGYAQSIYTLPVSLFGMSVSAAELPAMAQARGSVDEIAAHLRARLGSGLRKIAFFVVPSAMVLLALGHVVAGAIYQTGQFRREDTLYVWGILAGSAVGLLASTMGRLYASAFYALQDTRTPLRFAIVRVAATAALGLFAALRLPDLLLVDSRWRVGLTASAFRRLARVRRFGEARRTDRCDWRAARFLCRDGRRRGCRNRMGCILVDAWPPSRRPCARAFGIAYFGLAPRWAERSQACQAGSANWPRSRD
jgi:hypothetical protein